MIKYLIVVMGIALLPLGCGGGGPANATEFCKRTDELACDKVYQCVPAAARDAAFAALFGTTIAECKGMATADCADAATQCPMYNASAAETCVNGVSALTCAQFADPNAGLPAACDQACP